MIGCMDLDILYILKISYRVTLYCKLWLGLSLDALYIAIASYEYCPVSFATVV